MTTAYVTYAGKWFEEFGPSFMVPTAITAYPDIVDTSWHNDAAPTFTLPRYMHDGDLPDVMLWVEDPDPAQRELPTGRFTVTAGERVLYDGDDVTTALTVLARGAE